jgi:sugar transferase (PEP-CTERM system associated)
MLRIFNHFIPSRTLFLVLFENLVILFTIQLAALLRFGLADYSLLYGPGLLLKAVPVTILFQLTLYFHDLYDLRVVRDSRELFIRLLQSLGVSSILVAALYLLLPAVFLGQGVFVLTIFLLLGFLICWRIAFFWFDQHKGSNEPVLILGTGDLARKLASEILNTPGVGIRIVGFLTDDRAMIGKSLINPIVIGHVSELLDTLEKGKINRVVVAMPDSRGKLPVTELLDLKLKGATVEEGATLYEKITGKIAVENLRPSWLIFSGGFKKSRWTLLLKRLFGVLFSVIGLLVSLPIMIAVSIAIKLDSRGSVFFRQERVGENGRVFELLKFRSMCEDAEACTGPVWARKDDQRVTRVGKLLRKFRLDELPQFINVLKGDMSFVGPRPERPHFVRELTQRVPYYNLRHTIKPGITGWAQIKYKYGATLDDTIEKLQYDLFYIKNLSLSLDLIILFQTVKIVLLQRGAH